MHLTQDELFEALGILLGKIEACGASTQLTDAVVVASDIRQAVGNKWNPANTYAAKRVKELLAKEEAIFQRMDAAMDAKRSSKTNVSGDRR